MFQFLDLIWIHIQVQTILTVNYILGLAFIWSLCLCTYRCTCVHTRTNYLILSIKYLPFPGAKCTVDNCRECACSIAYYCIVTYLSLRVLWKALQTMLFFLSCVCACLRSFERGNRYLLTEQEPVEVRMQHLVSPFFLVLFRDLFSSILCFFCYQTWGWRWRGSHTMILGGGATIVKKGGESWGRNKD